MTLITSRAEFDSQCCDTKLQLGTTMIDGINAIVISEMALKMAQFCREPKHYIEVADMVYEELEPENKPFADRIAFVGMLEALAAGVFSIDIEGILYLDEETSSMSDEELEEHRVDAVLYALMDEEL